MKFLFLECINENNKLENLCVYFTYFVYSNKHNFIKLLNGVVLSVYNL